MQKPLLVVLCLALLGVIAGSLVLPELLSDSDVPMMQWSADDEVEGSSATEPDTSEPADGASLQRDEVAIATGAVLDAGERVATILRGRVVDKFQRAVPGANVWLEIGRSQRNARGNRGDRQRRIPEPVITDTEGRFAFQGQAFRSLRVALQVQHPGHALGMFDKDLGDTMTASGAGLAGAEVELGDLVLMSGGEIRGRITDLDGNGLASAEVTLEPDMQNPLRWVRDRDQLLSPTKTDNSGFYTLRHVTAGSFALTALAPRHTEGRSPGFTVEEDKMVDVPDIQLGPGYDLTGFVRNVKGQPVADATVVVRSSRSAQPDDAPGQGRGGRQGGRGAFFGRGREHRTRTDDKGRFFLDHLPGTPLELSADAKGYLDHAQDGIDATLGQVLNITLQEGLRITGVTQDSNGTPVELFALRAVRLRDLPDPTLASIDINAVMAQLRDGNLDEATRDQLRRQMQNLRGAMPQGGRGGPGGPGGGPGGRGRGDNEEQPDAGRGGSLGDPTRHADGAFVADGLQEGIYELHLQAADYARYRSAEIEVRAGVAAPHVLVTLDAGVYVGGRVVDERGDPIGNAVVRLRSENGVDFGAMRRGGRGGRGQDRQAANGQAEVGQPADMARMAAEFARVAQGANVNLEARTDRDGIFVMKHVPRGSFRLSAEHDGYADARSESFDLQADRSDFELQLGLLGTIFGRVSGFSKSEVGDVRVGTVMMPSDGNPMAMMSMFRGGGRGQGPFRTVDIDAEGNYRIEDLVPGDYVVRAWVGSAQQLMRELGPSFFDGSLAADAAVRGGGETRFDVLLVRPMLGSLTGSVVHNGENAVGFQVELRTSGNDTGGGNAGPGGRGGRGFGNRSQQATVDAEGRFTIKDVAAGSYELTIRSNGRRGAELLKDTVQVLADAALERSYSVVTASLRGTLTTDDGTDPSTLGGRVSLLPGLTEVPDNLNGWLRQNTSYDGRISDGGFSIDAVPPGGYLLVVQPRDRERSSLTVVLNGPQTVSIAVGRALQGTGNQPR